MFELPSDLCFFNITYNTSVQESETLLSTRFTYATFNLLSILLFLM